jgi:hypothetical protein
MKTILSILFWGTFVHISLFAQRQIPDSEKKAALMRTHNNYAQIANKKTAPKHIKPYHKTISLYMSSHNMDINDYYASLHAAPNMNGYSNILLYHFDTFSRLDSLKKVELQSGENNTEGYYNLSGKDCQFLIDPKTKKVVAYNLQFKKE